MQGPDLFGLIVSILMIANIGLFLHNRHLAAMVRELSAIVKQRENAEGPAEADEVSENQDAIRKHRAPFAWLFAPHGPVPRGR